MPLKVFREPFDNPDWQFEIKYDGFRVLAYIEHGSVRLVSSKGNVYKLRIPSDADRRSEVMAIAIPS